MTADAGAVRPHPNRPLLYTLIGLMQLFWTANFLIGKAALREFPAPLLAGLRILLAALILTPVYRRYGKQRLSRRDLRMFLWMGLIGVAVNQSCFLAGLGKTSVAHSSLIIGMSPIWVLLMAAWRRLERITTLKVAGLLAALGGLAVLNLEKTVGPGPTLAGDLLTLMGGSAFAFYTVMGKELNRRYGSLAANMSLYAAGALFLLPVVAWQGASFPFSQVSAGGWLALLYMAVFPSLVCYLIFYYALGYVRASRLSLLAYVQPLAATVGGVLWLGDRVTLPLVAGGAMILFGVFLTERG